ncbi:hypothetical protein EJB05_11452, partial [Eragrostis curvula]
MGLPRRFLNLIMEGRNPGAKTLRCIDLERQKFFNTRKPAQRTTNDEAATSAAVAAASKKIPRVRLPRPSVSFRAGAMDYSWSMSCFPLAGRTVLCADQCGRAFLFDLDTRIMGTLPDLHMPKSPSTASLLHLRPRRRRLDTANHVWSQVGEWTLPFQGKIEYVPELKLWFGLTAKEGYLAAADLSTILSATDSQPQLVGPWKELVEPPHDWRDVQRPQLVHLGCGRFCIARSFHIWMPIEGYDSYDPLTGYYFTVLTGADVMPCVRDGNGGSVDANCSDGLGSDNGGNVQVELEMIRHESRLHMYYGRHGNIMGVF